MLGLLLELCEALSSNAANLSAPVGFGFSGS